jgi:hypothetical protein
VPDTPEIKVSYVAPRIDGATTASVKFAALTVETEIVDSRTE